MPHTLELNDLWPEVPETRTLVDAFNFSRERLAKALRFNGETVFHHSLAVANIIAREFSIANADILALALLHDIVEDGGVDRAELAARFNEAMASSVMILTKDAYPQEEGKNKAVRKAVSMASDAVKIVKLADCLENCRSKADSTKAAKALANARKMLKHLNRARQSVEVNRAMLVVAHQLPRDEPVS